MMDKTLITGLILAGGRGSRMNGKDKGLVMLNDQALIAYVIADLKPQVNDIVINANRNLEDYARYGYPVIADDDQQGFLGPLAGILSALKMIKTPYLLTSACDTPHLPSNLAQKLYTVLTEHDADIAVVHDGNRLQPVFCLLKKELQGSLAQYLNSGQRKIDVWFAQHRYYTADFSDLPEAFVNINTPEELSSIKAKLAKL